MLLALRMFFPIAGITLLSLFVNAATVKLGVTTLVGRDVTSFGLEFFGGIPYAEPPLGKLRLQPPVRKFSLDVPTLDASEFGVPCLQAPAEVPSSEDCLTINIVRPAGMSPSDSGLPVMAFIHGGGFYAGSSSDYNASTFVQKSVLRGTPIIYAAFNYRLGPLGFPAGKEAASRKALNLGLKDQLTALEWLQHNIAAFGGDKTKVTVFGESAGSISIATLFFNSKLEHLVRAAILESGQAGTTFTFSAAHGQSNWNDFVNAVPECAQSSAHTAFQCLRTANSSTLLQAIEVSLTKANVQFPWVPVLDGPYGVYLDLASRLYEKGQFSRIPFIAGTNLDEGTEFTDPGVSSDAQIHNEIVSNFSESPADSARLGVGANKLLKLYPDVPALGSPYNTGNETFGLDSQFKRLAAIIGDLDFLANRRLWTQTASRAGSKVFGYLFSGPVPSSFPGAVPALGVSHGTELVWVFGGGYFVNPSPATLYFSGQMVDYWISFATSLDPNDGRGNDRPLWPQYTPSGEMILELHEDNIHAIKDNYRAEQISYINSNPTLFRH